MQGGTAERSETCPAPGSRTHWFHRRDIRRLLVLLAAGTAALFLLHTTPLRALLTDVQELRGFLEGNNLWAEVVYLSGVTCFVSLGTPRLIFYSVGGIAFGFWEGLLLAQIGTLAGSSITFLTVRWGGKDWVVQRYGERPVFRNLFQKVETVEAVALIRQLPITSVVINIGLALSHVRMPCFLLGSFVGLLPQGVIATLIGSGLADDEFVDGLGQFFAAALMAILISLLIWRQSRKKVIQAQVCREN